MIYNIYKIYKYELQGRTTRLDLPKGSKFLTVRSQFNRKQIWLQVPLVDELEQRMFVILTTGEPFECDDKFIYLGTFELDGGSFIGHVFEVIR